MKPLFFEDVVIGARHTSDTHTITAEDIVRFAREWDPQPFHLDPAAAEASLFGGLSASGLHTMAASCRLLYDTGLFRGTALAGAGIENLRFLAPVRPGDVLQVTITLAAKRAVRDATRGLVTVRLVTTAQAAGPESGEGGKGRQVLDWELLMLVTRRTSVDASGVDASGQETPGAQSRLSR